MILLLPGMDGTGELFRPLLKRMPEGRAVRTIRYPTSLPLTYPELERFVLSHLAASASERIVLVAESFSGPIALRLSTNSGLNLRAVVIVSSFASRPFGLWGHVLSWFSAPLLSRNRIHPRLLRTFLLGNKAADELVTATAQVISRVAPSVLAGRLRDALTSSYCSLPIAPTTRVIALFSKRDRLLGERGRKSILKVCPTIETYMLDAPHFALQVAPEQIVHKLDELGLLEE